jgi:hypothetical protein
LPSDSRRRITRPAGLVLVCTGLLVADFIIGGVAWARCINAGDTCSSANEWVDEVTLAVAALLIALIVGGTLAAVIVEVRATKRRPDTP